MSRPLDTIPASPLASPLDGRGSSILSEPSSVPPGFREGSASPPPSQDDFISRRPSMQFPSVSRADRIKLVGFLQSWSFDALSLTPNELLVCMGLIFESLGSMEGVDFDLGTLFPNSPLCSRLTQLICAPLRPLPRPAPLAPSRLPRTERIPQLQARGRRHPSLLLLLDPHGARTAPVPPLRRGFRLDAAAAKVAAEPGRRAEQRWAAVATTRRLCANGRVHGARCRPSRFDQRVHGEPCWSEVFPAADTHLLPLGRSTRARPSRRSTTTSRFWKTSTLSR